MVATQYPLSTKKISTAGRPMLKLVVWCKKTASARANLKAPGEANLSDPIDIITPRLIKASSPISIEKNAAIGRADNSPQTRASNESKPRQ